MFSEYLSLREQNLSELRSTDGHKSIWARINAGWREHAQLWGGKGNVLYAKELENEGKSTVFPKTRAAYRVIFLGLGS